MNQMRKILSAIVCICFMQISTAQEGIEIGGHAGIAYYFGDINTNYNLSRPGYLIGFKFRRNYNERLSLAATVDFARVNGSDESSNNNFERTRNLNFFSNVIDGSLVLEFNFFPYIHGSAEDFYTPYLFGGMSLLRYNPKTTLDGDTHTLRDLGTEGQFEGTEYGSLTAAFVYGIGFKWDINRDWSLNTQLSGRSIFSDYIDDVSQFYTEPNTLRAQRGEIAATLANRALDPEFGRPGTQRGNGKNNDVVYFVSFGVMRYFGNLKCPPISKIRG